MLCLKIKRHARGLMRYVSTLHIGLDYPGMVIRDNYQLWGVRATKSFRHPL